MRVPASVKKRSPAVVGSWGDHLQCIFARNLKVHSPHEAFEDTSSRVKKGLFAHSLLS